MPDSIQISIIVACRNEAGAIVPFLESLLAQQMNGMVWEAIIADGMSDDGTREKLDEYCAGHRNVFVIDNPGRIVSTGLNSAIRAARGEFILRMDAHTRYAPDYCRRCVDTLTRTGADNAGGPARTEVKGVLPRAIAAAYHSRFSTGGARFHDANFAGWVDTVPYGCWRAGTFQRVGLFDETLVRNQDDEFNLRLVRAGGKIWQDPAILSWYSPRKTLGGLFRQYFQYGFWKVAVIRKHRLPGSWRHMVPSAFVLANVLLLVAALVAALVGAGMAAKVTAALWATMILTYGSAILAASVWAARSSGWATLPYLPFAFATFHVSYGLGFVAGLRAFSKSRWQPSGDSVFARITR